MPPLLDLLSLAVLLVIAVELVLLRRDLARSPNAQAERDKVEGQTINVNLGGMPLASVPPASGAKPPPAPTAESALPAEAARGEPEEAAEAPAPRPVAYASAARPTSSGLIAVACPVCKAENSSYRSECFNCGASLG